ncbi:MAG: helix-turn-helix transcriptional regulator, partial [Chloroflexi bacterium]|nr:helix-turn-helix transcriptional regulator [Chloroflexota bacterium]
NLVQTNYVDLSGALPTGGVTLGKVSEPQYDLRTMGTVRLSRPGVFRTTGEVLVKDKQEGEARTETRDTVEEPEDGDLDRRVRALRAGLRLGRSGLSIKNATAKSTRTKSATAKITFGRDWLIYSTSVWPNTDEEGAWRQTFPDGYTSMVQLHRPAQFAFALGLGICEHVGVSGKPAPMTGTFHGFRTVKVERSAQMVLHGPVLYVDDPYGTIEMAEEGWPQICSMIFVKSRTYAAQKEYRFALLSIPANVGEVVDLPVSGMMQDCLKPVKTPLIVPEPEVAIKEDGSKTPGKRETSRSYTYRRRTVKRQSGNWGDREDEGREKEEIVEEMVTSPDEVPDPFPSERKRPDVVIFHQVGSRCRFQHHAYRDEETTRWRIETLRENPAIVETPRLGRPPRELEVPDDLRFDVVDAPPAAPEFILDLCLNPSMPRPPGKYPLLKRLSGPEIGHAMGSYWSLTMALGLLDRTDQERAAASAWYAFRFVLDLVRSFGAIVKSVCVIDECVVVVEIETAPSTGAVAWATFSGTGTYTLYVDRGGVQELVYPGKFSRAGPICESTLVETLSEHGWSPKSRKRDPDKDDQKAGFKAWATERLREARKWWQRHSIGGDGLADGSWSTSGGPHYRKWISVMARDMRRGRRRLGIEKSDAAERAGVSVAEYARIERGRVPKDGEGFGRMMAVARDLGVGALRLEYLRPYRTYMGVELSEDRLVMFLERLSSDISGSRALGYYVSPYKVVNVVEDVGLGAVLEGDTAGDQALFSLWMTTILVHCHGPDEDQYVRLARDSVDRTEILTADIASGAIRKEGLQIARHDTSAGDICEKMKGLLELGGEEERTTVVYATGDGKVEVADLRALMRSYGGQNAYLVTGTRESNGLRVIPCGPLGSEDEQAGWPEIAIDLARVAPERYEYDGVACVVAGGPGGGELPLFIRELELSR